MYVLLYYRPLDHVSWTQHPQILMTLMVALLRHSQGITLWQLGPPAAFSDSEELFNLDYQFAIGKTTVMVLGNGYYQFISILL